MLQPDRTRLHDQEQTSYDPHHPLPNTSPPRSIPVATTSYICWIGLDFGGSKNPQKRQEARKEKTERIAKDGCGDHCPHRLFINLAFFPNPFMFPHHKIQQTQKKHTQIFPTTQHNSTRLQLQPKKVIDPTQQPCPLPCLEHPGSGHLCGCRCLHAGPPFITSSRCRR